MRCSKMSTICFSVGRELPVPDLDFQTLSEMLPGAALESWMPRTLTLILFFRQLLL